MDMNYLGYKLFLLDDHTFDTLCFLCPEIIVFVFYFRVRNI